MEKSNILVTLAFDDKSITNIDTELQMQKDIIKLLEKYKKDGRISHYVVADDDVISDRLK